MKQVVDSGNQGDGTTTHTYNADGRMVIRDTPQGTLTYEYDVQTGRQTAVQGVTTRTEYGYDVQGRLTSVLVVDRLGTNPNELTEYIFNRFGQLDWEVGPNGVTKDNQYDDHGRLDRIVQFNDTNTNGQLDAGETMVAQFDYTHDAVGNRLSSAEQIGGLQQTFTYVYDDLNRLTQETLTSTTDSSRDYTTTYAFDLSSNRVGMSKDDGSNGTTDETTAYTFDRNDRLLSETSSTDGTTNYGYGPGNAWTTQTTKTQPNGTTTTQTYDVMGRLKTVSINATASGGAVTTESYTYSTNGIRTSRTVDGVKTVFLYDLQNPTGYAQILEQGIDSNGNGRLDGSLTDVGEALKAFTNGLDVITQAAIGQALHLLYDAHGSTRALTDASGAIVDDATAGQQVFSYDAYGNTIGFDTANALTALLYSGEFTNANTGGQYLRARYYDAASGRFNRLDPFAGSASNPLSFHKYGYTHGNPVSGVDPSGLFSLGELLSVNSVGQSLEKLNSAKNKVKTTKTTAEVLVALAFVQMTALARSIPQIQNQIPLMIGYYAYLFKRFETLADKPVNAATLTVSVPHITNYIAGLAGGSEAIRRSGFASAKAKTRFFSPGSNSSFSTWIPYTGSRSKDYVLSYASASAFTLGPILINALTGGNWVDSAVNTARNFISGFSNGANDGRVPSFTWHHNEILGVMELLDTSSHQSRRHTGGVKFYELITFSKYRS